MLASKADKLSDDAKLALKSAYESFDNLPPQEKVQQLMEVTAVALLASQTAVGGVVLRAVIKHAVRILPVMYAKEIVQHMGQVVSKVNPKTTVEIVGSTGQKVSIDSGSGGTVVAKKVEWVPHRFKHFPKKNLSWKETIRSTKDGGDAKYKHEIDIEALERRAWENGVPTNDGKNNKVFDFGNIVGANSGKETQYMIVKNSANTIHGHPITADEYSALIKLRN